MGNTQDPLPLSCLSGQGSFDLPSEKDNLPPLLLYVTTLFATAALPSGFYSLENSVIPLSCFQLTKLSYRFLWGSRGSVTSVL